MKKYCTWNGLTADGFVAVPRVFLRNYRKLGLTHSDAILVIEIMSYCWCDGSEHLPFPQLKQLAESLELHERNLRHALNKLRKAGLLTTQRKMHNLVYDFSGLFAKLAEFVDKSKQKARPITVSNTPTPVAPMRLKLRPKQSVASDGDTPALQRAPAPAAYNTHKEEHEKESLRDSGGAKTPSPLPPEEPYAKKPKPLGKEKTPASADEGLAKAKSILDKFAAMPVPNRVPVEQAGGKKFVFDEKKDPDSYTAHDVLGAYRTCWREAMECAPPPFSKKDIALSKKLLDEYGAKYVLSYLAFVFREWDAVSRRIEVTGEPTLAVLYGYRNSISALHRDPSRLETRKWGSNYNKSTDDFELE